MSLKKLWLFKMYNRRLISHVRTSSLNTWSDVQATSSAVSSNILVQTFYMFINCCYGNMSCEFRFKYISYDIFLMFLLGRKVSRSLSVTW